MSTTTNNNSSDPNVRPTKKARVSLSPTNGSTSPSSSVAVSPTTSNGVSAVENDSGNAGTTAAITDVRSCLQQLFESTNEDDAKGAIAFLARIIVLMDDDTRDQILTKLCESDGIIILIFSLKKFGQKKRNSLQRERQNVAKKSERIKLR